MRRLTVGIVDYGFGNHSSVAHFLRKLGFRVCVTSKPDLLNDADVLLIPGVGAFPAAMQSLHRLNLVEYLQQQARNMRPIIGICLGMQLLSSASYEFEYTDGLNIIPGKILPLIESKWHIGWNSVDCVSTESSLHYISGKSFYFNHSYYYHGPSEYQQCVTRSFKSFASIIRREKVVGMQFHPEKSQESGTVLFRNLILELTSGA